MLNLGLQTLGQLLHKDMQLFITTNDASAKGRNDIHLSVKNSKSHADFKKGFKNALLEL